MLDGFGPPTEKILVTGLIASHIVYIETSSPTTSMLYEWSLCMVVAYRWGIDFRLFVFIQKWWELCQHRTATLQWHRQTQIDRSLVIFVVLSAMKS